MPTPSDPSTTREQALPAEESAPDAIGGVAALRKDTRTPRWAVAVAACAGAMFVIGAIVNAAVTLVAPGAYGDLDDWAGSPELVARLWNATMGDNPRLWVPVVGVGYELLVGLLCMTRERRRRALGLAGATAFHLGLLALGLWAWALPMAAILGSAAYVTWPARVREGSPGDDDRPDVPSNGD